MPSWQAVGLALAVNENGGTWPLNEAKLEDLVALHPPARTNLASWLPRTPIARSIILESGVALGMEPPLTRKGGFQAGPPAWQNSSSCLANHWFHRFDHEMDGTAFDGKTTVSINVLDRPRGQFSLALYDSAHEYAKTEQLAKTLGIRRLLQSAKIYVTVERATETQFAFDMTDVVRRLSGVINMGVISGQDVAKLMVQDGDYTFESAQGLRITIHPSYVNDRFFYVDAPTGWQRFLRFFGMHPRVSQKPIKDWSVRDDEVWGSLSKLTEPHVMHPPKLLISITGPGDFGVADEKTQAEILETARRIKKAFQP